MCLDAPAIVAIGLHCRLQYASRPRREGGRSFRLPHFREYVNMVLRCERLCAQQGGGGEQRPIGGLPPGTAVGMKERTTTGEIPQQ